MATLLPNGKNYFVTNAGLPAVGYKIATFDAGTVNPRNTFSDAAGTIPNANPTILDARGEGTFFWNGSYKVQLQDPAGAPIWTIDGIASPEAFGAVAALVSDLASTNNLAKAAGQIGYNQALVYAVNTLGDRLLNAVTPRGLNGSLGNGVTDDTAGITTAANTALNVDMRGRSWKITSTIPLRAGQILDLRGANIVLACGATPAFSFTGSISELTILGGTFTGVASCVLFCQGVTATPATFADYASLIHIAGLRVNSTTITQALLFDRAVNSVFIDGVDFFTPNGIIDSAAAIDVMISNSIIFGATGVAGTRGIKLRSTGGTVFYNQGWQVVNSTIDNFEISHDIADCFDYQVTGGYHGVNAALAATTGYVFQFTPPAGSNLTDTIAIGGGAVIAGRTRFGNSGAGQAYNADMEALWVNVPGTAVALENNASEVRVRGMMKGGSGTAIGVVGTSNNAGIHTDLKVDATYTNGVVTNGAAGANCNIKVKGPTTGDIVGSARSNVLYDGVPIHSAGVASLNRAFSAANLGGAVVYNVGVAISTQAVGFARGETGRIIVNLPYSGANAATQNIQIATPAGMVVASGTGWAAGNLFLGAATGLLSVAIDYYCTADGSGNLTVTNQAGNNITINNQAYCGIVRNW